MGGYGSQSGRYCGVRVVVVWVELLLWAVDCGSRGLLQ